MPDAQTADVSRITITLIPSAQADLAELHAATALSKTDLVNRAITLYKFIDTEMRAGAEILVRRDSETSVVKFL